MLLQRVNVYRLDPSEAQGEHFAQWVGACRTVYNIALDRRRTLGQQHRLSYKLSWPSVSSHDLGATNERLRHRHPAVAGTPGRAAVVLPSSWSTKPTWIGATSRPGEKYITVTE